MLKRPAPTSPLSPTCLARYHDVVGDGRCPVVDTWWQVRRRPPCLTHCPLAARLHNLLPCTTPTETSALPRPPQTETGGHMIAPLPNVWRQKPGSATLPFFGARPAPHTRPLPRMLARTAPHSHAKLMHPCSGLI